MAQRTQIWKFGLKIFKNECQIWNQHLQNRGADKITLRSESWYFLAQKAHISKFSKTNFRFEISIFDIGYMKNIRFIWEILEKIKIRKLILFGSKYPNLGILLKLLEGECQIWNQYLQNRAHAEISLRLESFWFLTPKPPICAFGLKIFESKSAP